MNIWASQNRLGRQKKKKQRKKEAMKLEGSEDGKWIWKELEEKKSNEYDKNYMHIWNSKITNKIYFKTFMLMYKI